MSLEWLSGIVSNREKERIQDLLKEPVKTSTPMFRHSDGQGRSSLLRASEKVEGVTDRIGRAIQPVKDFLYPVLDDPDVNARQAYYDRYDRNVVQERDGLNEQLFSGPGGGVTEDEFKPREFLTPGEKTKVGFFDLLDSPALDILPFGFAKQGGKRVTKLLAGKSPEVKDYFLQKIKNLDLRKVSDEDLGKMLQESEDLAAQDKEARDLLADSVTDSIEGGRIPKVTPLSLLDDIEAEQQLKGKSLDDLGIIPNDEIDQASKYLEDHGYEAIDSSSPREMEIVSEFIKEQKANNLTEALEKAKADELNPGFTLHGKLTDYRVPAESLRKYVNQLKDTSDESLLKLYADHGQHIEQSWWPEGIWEDELRRIGVSSEKAKEIRNRFHTFGKNADSFEDGPALRFVRNEEGDVFSIQGEATLDPYGKGQAQIARWAKQMIEEGMDPEMPIRVENSAGSPFQDEIIGPLMYFAEDIPPFRATVETVKNMSDSQISRRYDEVLKEIQGTVKEGSPDAEALTKGDLPGDFFSEIRQPFGTPQQIWERIINRIADPAKCVGGKCDPTGGLISKNIPDKVDPKIVESTQAKIDELQKRFEAGDLAGLKESIWDQAIASYQKAKPGEEQHLLSHLLSWVQASQEGVSQLDLPNYIFKVSKYPGNPHYKRAAVDAYEQVTKIYPALEKEIMDMIASTPYFVDDGMKNIIPKDKGSASIDTTLGGAAIVTATGAISNAYKELEKFLTKDVSYTQEEGEGPDTMLKSERPEAKENKKIFPTDEKEVKEVMGIVFGEMSGNDPTEALSILNVAANRAKNNKTTIAEEMMLLDKFQALNGPQYERYMQGKAITPIEEERIQAINTAIKDFLNGEPDPTGGHDFYVHLKDGTFVSDKGDEGYLRLVEMLKDE